MSGIAPALSKHTIWGFALQTDFDVPNTTPGDINWWSYDNTLTYGQAGGNELFDVSDMKDSPSEALSTGDWGAGDIGFPLYADATRLNDLVEWISTRNSYNQPTYASLYLVSMIGGSYVVEGWQDVAVAQAQLELRARAVVRVTLSLLGRKEQIPCSVSYPAAPELGVPYNFNAVSVQANWNEGGYEGDTSIMSATIVHDNMLAPAEDGFTFAGSLNPTYLEADGGYRATLDLEKKFLNSTWFTAFKSHLRSAGYITGDGKVNLGLSFIITGTSTLTVELPELLLNDHPRNWPSGTASRIPETMRAAALRSRDGATAPIDWAVT